MNLTSLMRVPRRPRSKVYSHGHSAHIGYWMNSLNKISEASGLDSEITAMVIFLLVEFYPKLPHLGEL